MLIGHPFFIYCCQQGLWFRACSKQKVASSQMAFIFLCLAIGGVIPMQTLFRCALFVSLVGCSCEE